ncbi:MAG TPA: PEP-CTERM sorting domain-containing protein [Gemmataceae bacterium]|jgi:hypothetical protein|nr:PEP-CTERM sorting domain-containing protein [Gemmataceae bacterium]
MLGKTVFASFGALVLATSVQAQVLFSDGFESYSPGTLDANFAGPNQAPNGGPGNPWFGPNPPNLQVVGPGGGLSSGAAGPNSGSQMVTAHFASDFDQNWYNLAHRLNNGNNVTGNVALKWSFYDPSGPGDTNYRDYAALGNYATASAGAASGLDYTAASGGNLNPGGATQRLSLGASNPTGFDATKYQARVVGASDGQAVDASGHATWFNVGTRSIGWHSAEILLGPDLGANTIVSFFIDNVDVLDHAIDTTGGVNVIELNAGFGTTGANYDDLSFSAVPVPEPSSFLLTAAGMLLAWRRSRRRS